MKEATNPFVFGTSTTAKTSSKKLDFTPVLIDKAESRAHHLMMNIAAEHSELIDLANSVIDKGNPTELVDLLTKYYGDDTIKADAEILDGCDDDQLSRMLESRRSDRSKAKQKGLRTNAEACRTYIASMYAELLIRVQTGKPYTGSSTTSDYDFDELIKDPDAIGRKVRSLQSSASHLRELAKLDKTAALKLKDIENQVARLNAYRPNVKTKVIISSDGLAEVRKLLAGTDLSSMSETEQEKLRELMAKLG